MNAALLAVLASTGTPPIALLAYQVALDLSALARAEKDGRKRASIITKSNAALRRARRLDKCPTDCDPDVWDALNAEPKRVVRTVAKPREAYEAELAELRAELARRDAEQAWAGTED